MRKFSLLKQLWNQLFQPKQLEKILLKVAQSKPSLLKKLFIQLIEHKPHLVAKLFHRLIKDNPSLAKNLSFQLLEMKPHLLEDLFLQAWETNPKSFVQFWTKISQEAPALSARFSEKLWLRFYKENPALAKQLFKQLFQEEAWEKSLQNRPQLLEELFLPLFTEKVYRYPKVLFEKNGKLLVQSVMKEFTLIECPKNGKAFLDLLKRKPDLYSLYYSLLRAFYTETTEFTPEVVSSCKLAYTPWRFNITSDIPTRSSEYTNFSARFFLKIWAAGVGMITLIGLDKKIKSLSQDEKKGLFYYTISRHIPSITQTISSQITHQSHRLEKYLFQKCISYAISHHQSKLLQTLLQSKYWEQSSSALFAFAIQEAVRNDDVECLHLLFETIPSPSSSQRSKSSTTTRTSSYDYHSHLKWLSQKKNRQLISPSSSSSIIKKTVQGNLEGTQNNLIDLLTKPSSHFSFEDDPKRCIIETILSNKATQCANWLTENVLNNLSRFDAHDVLSKIIAKDNKECFAAWLSSNWSLALDEDDYERMLSTVISNHATCCLEYLLTEHSYSSHQIESILLEAIRHNEFDMTRIMIEHCHKNQKSSLSSDILKKALLLSAENRNPEIMFFLLKKTPSLQQDSSIQKELLETLLQCQLTKNLEAFIQSPYMGQISSSDVYSTLERAINSGHTHQVSIVVNSTIGSSKLMEHPDINPAFFIQCLSMAKDPLTQPIPSKIMFSFLDSILSKQKDLSSKQKFLQQVLQTLLQCFFEKNVKDFIESPYMEQISSFDLYNILQQTIDFGNTYHVSSILTSTTIRSKLGEDLLEDLSSKLRRAIHNNQSSEVKNSQDTYAQSHEKLLYLLTYSDPSTIQLIALDLPPIELLVSVLNELSNNKIVPIENVFVLFQVAINAFSMQENEQAIEQLLFSSAIQLLSHTDKQKLIQEAEKKGHTKTVQMLKQL